MRSAQAKYRISDWFRQLRQPLRQFLQGRNGVPQADIDDVAQEVFLRLMRYETADLIRHPKAYVFKIATNVAAEWSLRARARLPHDSRWLPDLADDDEPESEIARAQSRQQVARALASLTEQQREVLTLFFAEELGHAEIAVRLGTSLRSVRRQFAKSYARLRIELESESLGASKHGCK